MGELRARSLGGSQGTPSLGSIYESPGLTCHLPSTITPHPGIQGPHGLALNLNLLFKPHLYFPRDLLGVNLTELFALQKMRPALHTSCLCLHYSFSGMPFPYSLILLSRFLANVPSLLPEHEGCVSTY